MNLSLVRKDKKAQLSYQDMLGILLGLLGSLGSFSSTVTAQKYLFGRAYFTTGGGPASVIMDFKGDSKVDLAVANSADHTVSILLGKPDGTLGAKTDHVVGFTPYLVAPGDFNGDGKMVRDPAQCEPNFQGRFL